MVGAVGGSTDGYCKACMLLPAQNEHSQWACTFVSRSLVPLVTKVTTLNQKLCYLVLLRLVCREMYRVQLCL
jgi:hypothetical protein